MRFSASLRFAAVVCASLTAATFSAQSQAPTQAQVAATPPMGWNSWNYFAGRVTDKDIRDSADQIVASGMKDAGYIYVNIDDTWQGERDASGVLHANSKFPDMKGLADYVHSKGLKLGIYSGPGPKTCAGYAGSLGHEEQDAKMYADWGIDYLKYDLFLQFHSCRDGEAGAQRQGCANAPHGCRLRQDGQSSQGHWAPHCLFRYASTGGTTCGSGRPASAAQSLAHHRRYPGALAKHLRHSQLNRQEPRLLRHGPGHWNDPDMLEVGNGKLSLAENRTHFSMWAMLAAPLLAGNDLPNMKPEVKAILTNRDVIAINQDPLGHQARYIYSKGEVEVWARDLKGGAKAVAIVNVGSDVYSTHPFHLDLARLGLHGPQRAKDLWTGKEMDLTNNMPIELPSHDILLLRIDSHPK